MCMCAYSGVQLWFIGLSTDTTRTTKSIHKLNTAKYPKTVRKKVTREITSRENSEWSRVKIMNFPVKIPRRKLKRC